MEGRHRKGPIVHPQRRARLGLTLALALATTFIASSPAAPTAAHQFDNRKSDNSFVTFASNEDNDYHYLWWNHFVHFQQYDQYDARTDLVVKEQPRRGYNGDTDIIWWVAPQNELGFGNDGTYRCVKVNWTNLRCNQGQMKLTDTYPGQVPANSAWFVVCHELGHAYGLQHLDTWEGGCMLSGFDRWNPPASGGWLNDHMIKHINAYY